MRLHTSSVEEWFTRLLIFLRSKGSWSCSASCRSLVETVVYGPMGAQFDFLGNVYWDFGGGRKEYIGAYGDQHGNVREQPGEDDCCACM
jgi:hypothetical protein